MFKSLFKFTNSKKILYPGKLFSEQTIQMERALDTHMIWTLHHVMWTSYVRLI